MKTKREVKETELMRMYGLSGKIHTMSYSDWKDDYLKRMSNTHDVTVLNDVSN